jgi:hypothetical protein
MADGEFDPQRAWDEYEWERFLQQQDRKTEKYMELLDKYIDHPERDRIIAQEMGWKHLLDDNGSQWSEEIDALFENELDSLEDDDSSEDEEDEDDSEDEAEGFEDHPLYLASFALTVWMDQLFDEHKSLESDPAAIKLATQAAIASAKLAAALSDDDMDEIGMTIAYLKRALKAITLALEAGVQLRKHAFIGESRFATLNQRLFQIRDGIIEMMGDYRSEWRRRFGGS